MFCFVNVLSISYPYYIRVLVSILREFVDVFCARDDGRISVGDQIIVYLDINDDGKILAYSNVSNQNFIVKGYQFNLKKFLQSDSLAKKYLRLKSK